MKPRIKVHTVHYRGHQQNERWVVQVNGIDAVAFGSEDSAKEQAQKYTDDPMLCFKEIADKLLYDAKSFHNAVNRPESFQSPGEQRFHADTAIGDIFAGCLKFCRLYGRS